MTGTVNVRAAPFNDAPIPEAERRDLTRLDFVVGHLTEAIENVLAGKRRSADSCLIRAWHLLHATSNSSTSDIRPSQDESSVATAHRGGLAPWQVRRIATYIDSNLNSPVTIQLLAKLARLSRYHFSRAFKASFGSPPHRYVMRRRMELAQEMMLRTKFSLSQIALECGLADQAHLTKLFRRMVGITPLAWRRALPQGAQQ
jgi:AraC family transcriptional regulator